MVYALLVPPWGTGTGAVVLVGLPGVENPPDWLSYCVTIWLNCAVSCASVSE